MNMSGGLRRGTSRQHVATVTVRRGTKVSRRLDIEITAGGVLIALTAARLEGNNAELTDVFRGSNAPNEG